MFLSIIIPCYNEEKRLPPSFERIYSFLEKKDYESEIILVNDGSKDKTSEIIQEYTKRNRSGSVKVIGLGYKKNRGKGYATKIGMLAGKGEYLYLCDSDLSTPIEELDNFLSARNDADIIIGSRALDRSHVRTSFFRKILGRFGNLLISTILIKNIKDTQAGFKLFSRKCKILFEKQKIERWGFDFEILYLAQRLNFKIKELAVKWEHKDDSRVKPLDYFKTLSELIKIRLTNYKLNGNNSKN